MCFAFQLNNPDEGAERFYFEGVQTETHGTLLQILWYNHIHTSLSSGTNKNVNKNTYTLTLTGNAILSSVHCQPLI